MQDDHLVVVVVVVEDQEEAKTIAKEIQALNEDMGGTILIEPLLNPLLLNFPHVVKLDAI